MSEKGVKEKQTPGQILEDAKLQLGKAMRNRVIPSFVPAALQPITSRIYLLGTEDYIEAGSQSVKITDEPDDETRDAVNRSTAVYLPNYYSDGKPAIIVKRSYLENTPDGKLKLQFPELLAEEYGHALVRVQEKPLNSMSDMRQNSYLFPFASIDNALDQLSKQFGHPVTVDDINVILRGFKTIYRDMKSRDQYVYGDVLEETRSAVIQTVLTDIVVGQQVSPFASSENQYAAGRELLADDTVGRRSTSQSFVDGFVSSAKDLRKGMEKLFKGLYYNDVNAFVLSLSSSDTNNFTNAILGCIEEHEKRMNLPR